MSRLPFLLEIGAEEIPDWMIPGALENLRALFAEVLGKASLAAADIRTDATPRRLVLRAEGLAARQADTEEKITGPAKAAPPQAVAGFARKQGVNPENLTVETTPRGEYYVCTRKVAGRATRDILAEALPGMVLKIYFPKTMYWTGKNGPRFIRPIRWLVALLGEEVVPFEVAGVPSGNITSGHRRLGAASIPVTIADYEAKLRANGVILSAAERRKRIEDGITVPVKPDAALLETLTYLTEYPTPIVGGFDPAFLELPEEVLTTVMRHHQKYFSVAAGGGGLAPQFVAVMNTDADPEGLVRHGNERVLRARFNDARFFWETDQKKKLAARVQDLAHVTFQAKLGSYLEKTGRVVALVKELGGDEHAARAAFLAKADLTTELVKEFTELQGVVGGLYARAQGEPEPVWQAVYDHYKPESMEDSIPRSHTGQLVSIADKLDTLRGCFGVGLVPTGSRDPFALRRAAQGIVKTIVEGGLRLPLRKHLEGELEPFVLDRVRFYFREIRGFRYDEVNAVIASGWDDLVDVEARLTAIQGVRPTENFEPLAASFKRIRNILLQAEFTGGGAVEEALVEAGPEADLYREFRRVREAARTLEYRPALEAIAGIRPVVDLFFDKVLVNAPDERIRQNRLTLLHTLLAEFSTIADFSEIVTSS
ncbi:MAG: glycine--tRNA ligase subunit beta [Bryobacteraceae bacterium]